MYVQVNEKITYKSDKVLGELYREIRMFETCINEDTLPEFDTIDNWPQFEFPGHEKFHKVASKAFDAYAMEVDLLMKKFGIDECSLLTNVLTFSSRHMAGKNDKESVQELVDTIVQRMFAKHRERFDEQFKNVVVSRKKLAKASAYYHVCQRKNQERKRCNLPPIYGFPWIASEELAQIAQHRSSSSSNGRITRAANNLKKEIARRCHENETELENMNSNRLQRICVHILNQWFEDQCELHTFYFTDVVEQQICSWMSAKVLDVIDQGNRDCGLTIVKTLIKFMEYLFLELQASNNQHIYKIALLAYGTLTRLTRTCNPSYVMKRADDATTPKLFVRMYHLGMFHDQFKAFVENNAKKREIEQYLKEKTNVIRLVSTVVRKHGRDRDYLLVCAHGTKWALLELEKLVQSKNFYTDTCNAIGPCHSINIILLSN